MDGDSKKNDGLSSCHPHLYWNCYLVYHQHVHPFSIKPILNSIFQWSHHTSFFGGKKKNSSPFGMIPWILTVSNVTLWWGFSKLIPPDIWFPPHAMIIIHCFVNGHPPCGLVHPISDKPVSIILEINQWTESVPVPSMSHEDPVSLSIIRKNTRKYHHIYIYIYCIFFIYNYIYIYMHHYIIYFETHHLQWIFPLNPPFQHRQTPVASPGPPRPFASSAAWP